MTMVDPLPLPVDPPFPDPPTAGPVEPPARPGTPVPFSPRPTEPPNPNHGGHRRVNGHAVLADGPNGTPPPIPPPPIVPIPLPD